MPEFHLPFAAEDREVAAELQAALVDLIDLALIGKQATLEYRRTAFSLAAFRTRRARHEEGQHASAGGQRDLGARTRPAGSRGNTNPRSVPDER